MNTQLNRAGTLADDAQTFDLPSRWHVELAEPQTTQPLSDPQSSVQAALADPLHAPPLSELVGPGDQVCIAFAPPGSLCPEHILVPALLKELEIAGVYDQDITLLCANGPYGRTDYEHKIAQLGATVVERYRVVDHDVSQVIHLGQKHEIPLTVNRHALEADLLIATGFVAPHLHAGYSGGSETVSIGCAGDATTEAIHAPRFLYHPLVRPGQVKGNPFQKVIRSLAKQAGLRFIINTILDPKGQIADVQAGDFSTVHQYMVFAASSLYNKPVPQTYDVVIAGIDPLYDTNLYQAILGALFVGLAPQPAVRPGGVIILPARTPEAVGQASNAQHFYGALQSARSPDTLVTELWERVYRPGEARAFQLARLLEQNQVIIVGSEFPAVVEACHLQVAADMDEAIDMTRWLLGDDLDALIVPHALHTMPVPPPPEWDNSADVSRVDMRTW
jgi:nickel-dependent lactate racemase